MEITDIPVLITGVLYLILNLLIQTGLRRRWQQVNSQPVVSVIIAARNEAENLAACLEHLVSQHYPVQKMQVLILNDRSSDDTGRIAWSFARRYPHMKVIDVMDDIPGLKGKMNVLATGIREALGEIILITDADCRPDPGWVASMTSFMAGGVSMIGGLTHITGTGFFARIQTCDWLFLQSIAAGTTGIGIPVSILGNNFAFRRETYELTGGFESMGFSLTEDMALLQAFKRIHGVAIAYPLSHGTLVQSEAVGSVSDLIHQRLRWVAGGRRSGIWGWLLMIVTFLLHLLLPVVLLISTGNIFLLIITGAIFLADFSLLAAASSRLGSRIPLFYFPAFEVYYFLYTTVIGFLSLLPMKIRWKGREYK